MNRRVQLRMKSLSSFRYPRRKDKIITRADQGYERSPEEEGVKVRRSPKRKRTGEGWQRKYSGPGIAKYRQKAYPPGGEEGRWDHPGKEVQERYARGREVEKEWTKKNGKPLKGKGGRSTFRTSRP